MIICCLSSVSHDVSLYAQHIVTKRLGWCSVLGLYSFHLKVYGICLSFQHDKFDDEIRGSSRSEGAQTTVM